MDPESRGNWIGDKSETHLELFCYSGTSAAAWLISDEAQYHLGSNNVIQNFYCAYHPFTLDLRWAHIETLEYRSANISSNPLKTVQIQLMKQIWEEINLVSTILTMEPKDDQYLIV